MLRDCARSYNILTWPNQNMNAQKVCYSDYPRHVLSLECRVPESFIAFLFGKLRKETLIMPWWLSRRRKFYNVVVVVYRGKTNWEEVQGSCTWCMHAILLRCIPMAMALFYAQLMVDPVATNSKTWSKDVMDACNSFIWCDGYNSALILTKLCDQDRRHEHQASQYNHNEMNCDFFFTKRRKGIRCASKFNLLRWWMIPLPRSSEASHDIVFVDGNCSPNVAKPNRLHSLIHMLKIYGITNLGPNIPAKRNR